VAVRTFIVCDRCGAHSASAVKIRVGEVGLTQDLCEECKERVIDDLGELGFRPIQKRVGHSNRAAYVAKSGTAFTASDVRQWLRERDGGPAPTGRIAASVLEEYADNH
jgi:hypothetical protein